MCPSQKSSSAVSPSTAIVLSGNGFAAVDEQQVDERAVTARARTPVG